MHTVRNWFLDKTTNNTAAITKHFIALSTNTAAVQALELLQKICLLFGILLVGAIAHGRQLV